MAVHVYAPVSNGSVTIGIARWIRTPLKDAELIHIIEKSVTAIGALTFSLKDMNIQVLVDDFVVVLADSENPFPVSYMGEHSLDMPGNYPQLVIHIPTDASLFREGQLIILNDQWQQRRMVFAMSIDVESKTGAFECRYKRYDFTINYD